MLLPYLCLQAPLWAFYCTVWWTQWRFRLILSGLQRVHGNTNETCSWPVSTDGSRHRALSYNVDGVHLGARLDRADGAPTPGFIQKASGMDKAVSPSGRGYWRRTSLYFPSLCCFGRGSHFKMIPYWTSFFSPPPLFLYHILSHFFSQGLIHSFLKAWNSWQISESLVWVDVWNQHRAGIWIRDTWFINLKVSLRRLSTYLYVVCVLPHITYSLHVCLPTSIRTSCPPCRHKIRTVAEKRMRDLDLERHRHFPYCNLTTATAVYSNLGEGSVLCCSSCVFFTFFSYLNWRMEGVYWCAKPSDKFVMCGALEIK